MSTIVLGSLLEGETASGSEGWTSLPVLSVTADSREVAAGAIFFALQGANADGRSFAADAATRGATAIVTDGDPKPGIVGNIPLVKVANARRAYAHSCARFYRNPSSDLMTIGVTGTNGKTSVSWILAHALTALEMPAALCGTLGLALSTSGDFTDLANTTPDPRVIQSFLANAKSAGALAAVLEATSQGVVQYRTYGTQWNAAVFTNLTRDHLDLHGSMEDYYAAKLRLFTDELALSEKIGRVAVINVDDPAGPDIVSALTEHSGIRAFTYSASGKSADARIVDEDCTMLHTEFAVEIGGARLDLRSRLIGRYNLENLLAAASTLITLGFDAEGVARAIERVPPVSGRLEVIDAGGFQVVVDYAHTPDGLVQAQRSLRPLTRGRLITVFGCGGDRDRGKRPLMGSAVAELSDIGVLTSDNPRTEDPERIIDDIVPGVERAARANFTWHREADRRKALTWALGEAKPGDVVLVAGKGHEDYQEISGVRHAFSDQEISRSILQSAKDPAKGETT